MADLKIEGFCGGLFQTNGYLVQAGDSNYLFDAPEGIASWVADQEVRLDGLLLTHQHHDHIVDAGKVQDLFHCPIWAHSHPSDELTLAKQLEQSMGISSRLDPYSVEHLLEGVPSLSLRNLDMEVLHVPGHSPDSVCFRFTGQPLVIGGDVLFRNSIGRTDFPNGDHELLLSGIREKLYTLPDDTTVLPGHGPATTIGFEKETNPFVRL